MPTNENLAYDCDHLSAITFRPSESRDESIKRNVPAAMLALALSDEYAGGTIHAAIVRVDGTPFYQPLFSVAGHGTVTGRPGPLQACRDWFKAHVPPDLQGTFAIWEEPV